MRRVFAYIAEFALILSLAGCVIPISHRPGTEDIPCHGLKNEVPQFIRVGETTREEVQQQLGKPTGIAADGSWMTYGCTISEGGRGLGFAVPFYVDFQYLAEETVLYRRLILRFDASAVVSRADIEQKSCRMRSDTYGAGHETAPCLELEGTDLVDVNSLPFLAGQGTFVVYEPVEWYPDSERIFWPNWKRGVLIVTNRSLMIRSGCNPKIVAPCDLRKTTTEIANLPFSEIASVEFKKDLFTTDVVIISLKNGISRAFRVFRHYESAFASGDKTQAAFKSLQEHIAAASAHLPE